MSKFKGIFDAAKGKEASAELENQSQDLVVDHKKPATDTEPEQKRGRPKGKRTHPDYEQVTAYIRKDTHASIKIALLQEGQKREFSQLVQELLDEWLKLRT